MIGSHLLAMGVSSEDDSIVLFDVPPMLLGQGEIGADLNVSMGLAQNVLSQNVRYQWFLSGAPITGATDAVYTVEPVCDLAEVMCEVTATLGEASQSLQTGPVTAHYAAPRGPAALMDEVLDSNSGLQVIDVSTAVTGQNLSFSVSGNTSATVDVDTGLVAVETDQGQSFLDLNVTASNSGGVWSASLHIALEEPPQPTQVLDFSSSSTGLATDAHGLPGGDIDAAGIWMSTMVYIEDVSAPQQTLMALAQSDVGSVYIQVQPSQIKMRRGGGDRNLNAFDAPTSPGWYLVTARMWRNLSGDVQYQMWRNELESSRATFDGNINVDALDRLGWSMSPDSSPTFGANKMSALAWGTGDPFGYHQAVYNNGQFTDPLFYDFSSDALTDLVGYEDGAREDTAVEPLSVEEMSGAWAQFGRPRWANISPAYAAGETGVFTAVTVTSSGAVAEFVTTVTLPSAAWSDPVADISKAKIWAHKGFGSIEIVSASVTTEASVATVSFMLSRDVFAEEILLSGFRASWLSDAVGNTSGHMKEMTVDNVSTSVAPVAVLGLSNGDVSFDFAQPYPAGVSDDGIMWVVDAGLGVEITQKHPLKGEAPQGTTTRIVNGTMKNPLRRDDNMQGYGSIGSEAHNRFDPALAIDFPQVLRAGESLIGVKNNLLPTSENGGRGSHPVNIEQYQGLIVTDFIPGQNDFAPALVGYNDVTRPSWRTIDVAAIAAGLPDGYDTSSFDKPDFDIVLERIERLHPALFQFSQVEMKREMTPAGFTNQDGYGVNFIATTSSVLLLLLSNESSLAQRERAVRWIVHHYMQWYGVGSLYSDGGHNQGAWGFLVLGDYWANGGMGLPTLMQDVRGNENTVFKIADQAQLDVLTLPHDGTDTGLPDYNRLSDISSVTGSQITLSRIDGLSNSNMRDATRALGNLVVVRPSDGVEARVTDYDDGTGELTLSPVEHGFSIGDTVYCRAPWVPQIGDYDWSIGGLRGYSPSSNASYRRLNQWSAQVMAVRALGLMHPNFDAIQGYVELANTVGAPTADNDFPSHHSRFVYGPNEAASGTSNWVQQFWSANWGTIKTVRQLF